MEIERKWLLKKLPDVPCREKATCYQAYVSVKPVVRIREQGVPCGGAAGTGSDYRMTVKGKGSIAREEIEFPITAEQYRDILRAIGDPAPIRKDDYYYDLTGRCDESVLADPSEGLRVDIVDPGTPDSFLYAEVEFQTEEAARAFTFPFPECAAVDVSEEAAWKMNNYWARTRMKEQ